MLQSHSTVSVPPIAVAHHADDDAEGEDRDREVQDSVREIEPGLGLGDRGDDPLPRAVARFRRPVDGSGLGPPKDAGDAQPLDVGEQTGDQQRAREDGHADDDDQRGKPGRCTGHDDGEAHGGERRPSSE